jgi:hypothetical protein
MRKLLFSVLALAVSGVGGYFAARGWADRQTQARGRDVRPKMREALDELIGAIEAYAGPMGDIVFLKDQKISEDERQMHMTFTMPEGVWYDLFVEIQLTGNKAGYLSVSLSTRREETPRILHWPEIGGFGEPESWLVERIERLVTKIGATEGMLFTHN